MDGININRQRLAVVQQPFQISGNAFLGIVEWLEIQRIPAFSYNFFSGNHVVQSCLEANLIHVQQLYSPAHNLLSSSVDMAAVCDFVHDVQGAAAKADIAVFINSHTHSQFVGGQEAHAGYIVSQTVRVFFDNRNAGFFVLPIDAASNGA